MEPTQNQKRKMKYRIYMESEELHWLKGVLEYYRHRHHALRIYNSNMMDIDAANWNQGEMDRAVTMLMKLENL